MADGTSPLTRCGIDTVEIARVQRLLVGPPHGDLLRIFSKEELFDVGEGPGGAASLAARIAATEACLKLFPRETALELIGPADFALTRDGNGAPRVVCSPRALQLITRHRLNAIAVLLAHDKTSASAVAVGGMTAVMGPVAQQATEDRAIRTRRVILFTLAFGVLTAIAAAAQAADTPEPQQTVIDTGRRRG
jgi:phosphopantetheinyl transferase (holo-ACP synthase)